MQKREIIENYLKKYGFESQDTQALLNIGAIPALKGFTVYRGKASDSIFGGPIKTVNSQGQLIKTENPPLNDKNGEPIRIIVRTGRISTHDIVRGIIPFKEQILALNHNFILRLVHPFMPHAQQNVGLSDQSPVSFAKELQRFPIENVIRMYSAKSSTTTSLHYNWFEKGNEYFSGIFLPRYADQLTPNGMLPFPMDTPSTKDDTKDVSVAPEELFTSGFDEQQYRHIRNQALVIFGMVFQYLKERGIVLVDTKTEHGKDVNNKIFAMDELYTLDSSRFWKLNPDGLIICEDDEPVSFSKEFARGIAKGNAPFTDQERITIAERYMESIELITGARFNPLNGSWKERVVNDIQSGLTFL